MYTSEIGRWGVVDAMAEKNNDVSGYAYAINNPRTFTDPFGLDTSSANANFPVHQGDVILFGKRVPATHSVDEATVVGKRTDNSTGMTLIFPGSFSRTLRPGPTPITSPRILPPAIPIAYNTVDTYLKGPSVVEDIAQLLERFGVDSEVLRGPKDIVVFAKQSKRTGKERGSDIPDWAFGNKPQAGEKPSSFAKRLLD